MNFEKELYPLIEKYPEIEYDFPVIPLGNYPTPVYKMNDLGSYLKHPNLWIKRDDLTSGIYSGNKIRKFEFILGWARKLGRRTLLSWGSIGSNQVLASAILSQGMPFKVEAMMFKQPVTEHVLTNLKVDHNLGTRMHYAGNLISFGIKLVLLYFSLLLKGSGPFLIPYLFASIPSVLAYVNAVIELKIQIESGECSEPDHIIVPLGTGGTFCGIELGVRLTGLKSKVIGVRITERIVCNEYIMRFIINRTVKYLNKTEPGLNLPFYKTKDINIDHTQAGNGYGETTGKCTEAMRIMKECEGIKLDQTYTGKAAASFIEFAGCDENGSSNILYWHTLNSVDLKKIAGPLNNFNKLPKKFHGFFKEHLSGELNSF